MWYSLWCIPFFLFALDVARWDRTPNSSTARWIAFAIGCMFAYGPVEALRQRLMAEYQADRARNRQQRESAKRFKETRKAEAKRAVEWAAYSKPTSEQFLNDTEPVRNINGAILAHTYLATVCTSFPHDLEARFSVDQFKAMYADLVRAAKRAISRYPDALPPVYRLAPTRRPTVFTTTVLPTEEEMQPANAALAEPFRGTFDALFPQLFNRPDNDVHIPQEPQRADYTIMDLSKDRLEREYKAEMKIYERAQKEHAAREAELYKEQTLTQRTFWGTPFYYYAESFMPAPQTVPFEIPDDQRFAGTWIIAPPGRGKTNLLHNLIAEDRTHGTVVLMDSKGDLINAYRGIAAVIDPKTANINPLQLGSSVRSVEFLEYIFSALLETPMTSLQKTLFRSVLTLLLKVPNATLETFRQVLTTGIEPYSEYVNRCDPATADFFTLGKPTEFNSPTYRETKQQILWRLRLILSNEYLRAIFTSPTTNVPFSELLDSSRLIIIDNSKDDLGEEGAEFFGRFFIALTWMAAVSRSRLKQDDKVPVYFYIDECHTVIKRDTKITAILDECRSQKIALVLAHQRIGQIEPNVIDALNNCAIRLANSDDDAESLAKRFRVEAAELRLPVGQFACYVRDKTPAAVTINVPLFDTSQFPPPDAPREPPPRASESARDRARPRAVPTDEVEDF